MPFWETFREQLGYTKGSRGGEWVLTLAQCASQGGSHGQYRKPGKRAKVEVNKKKEQTP